MFSCAMAWHSFEDEAECRVEEAILSIYIRTLRYVYLISVLLVISSHVSPLDRWIVWFETNRGLPYTYVGALLDDMCKSRFVAG